MARMPQGPSEMIYRCVEVIGDGQLCGEACSPGFVRCRHHRNREDRAALRERVALAREYVLQYMEQHVEALSMRLIELALNSQDERVSLAAIEKAFGLMGADKLVIELGGETLEHIQGRDERLIQLMRTVPTLADKAEELATHKGRQMLEAESRETA